MVGNEMNLRDKAKLKASELLILHGYNGFSFGLLASDIATTRANLHYHFKNKQALVEEIIDDYATATTIKFRQIWLDEKLDFSAKIHATFKFNERRFRAFNDKETYGRPWSLIARMRNDHEALSDKAVNRLRRFSADLFKDVSAGVRMCIKNGSLNQITPIDDVVLQVASVILSAGPITQDSGDIKTLRRLYEALNTTVLKAYGA